MFKNKKITSPSASMFLLLVTIILVHLFLNSRSGNHSAVLQSPTGTNRFFMALANYGFSKSGRVLNTFFIPPKANLGSNYVIYWKEENMLFTFPVGEVTTDSVTMPHLVIGKSWSLDSKNFKLPTDHSLATSTYLDTWEWALERMYDAVAKGKMQVLSHQP
jgi:hypothetical protein